LPNFWNTLYRKSFRGTTSNQVASRPDEMNCNVHKTLTMNQDTNTIRKSLNTFKENIRGSLKSNEDNQSFFIVL